MVNRSVRSIGLAAVVAIAAAGGYKAYDYWSAQQASPTGIVLHGNIDIREADLAFNISGRIESMLAEEGDLVEKGQLLASLEAGIYLAEAAAAEARVVAQRAVLDRMRAGNRPEEIEGTRANVRGIEAELQDARENLARTEKLASDHFAPLQKLGEDRTRVKNLEAQLKAAQQTQALMEQGPRQEDIAEARAQLRAGEAEFTLAQRRLDFTELHAKDGGVVKTRVVEPGAVVLAHTPAYTVALSDPVWVRTFVSEPDLGRIYPGMTAEVFTDSFPDEGYNAQIGFISPVAEFTPKTVETREVRTSLVYRLRVIVDNPDNRLRQGMPVTVRLEPGADVAGNGETTAK